MTERKDRFVHCRLSEDDYNRFHANAEALELAPSQYLRYLVRIPVGDATRYSVVAIDVKAMDRARSELVRWGHHYNQAVHALNTIAFYVRRGGGDIAYFTEQMERANAQLQAVECGERAIRSELDAIGRSVLIGG